ncbi:energy transducer TonB [Flavobacterium sp. W1B]|uniref:energy transducer TonB n=1 Tax=Flavobacterium sp. W1B TaxID=3394146 RepID=UPI0039BC2F94
MKNKDLDNFFKSRSNSFNEMPSDDLWKKIQNNLTTEPNPKSNFKKTFFTMALPIITLISIASLYLNNYNSVKSNKIILNNDSIKKEKSLPISDSNIQLKSLPNTVDLKKKISTNEVPNNKHITNQTTKKEDFKTLETSNFQDKIYSIDEVDAKPEFPGDINKLYLFINKRFKTPKQCPGGRITVTFVIEKDGSLTDIKTVKHIGFGTAEEAVRVLKESPKWKPGKHDGKIVRVQYTLPISIQATSNLEEDNLIYNMAGINVKPEFIGGKEKLLEFIALNYKTPKDCPSGKVYVTFIIEKDGSLTDIKAIRDIGYGSGEEAIRLLKECPNWEAGEQNGKKVRVLHSLAIDVKASNK